MSTENAQAQRFACSPQQERLVSLQHEGRLFRARLLLQLHGPVDVDRLKFAVNKVIESHAILRTGFHRNQAGQPVCFVNHPTGVTLFEHRAEGSLEGVMESLYDQALHHPLHPGQPPLLRIELVATRRSENYLLLFSMPSLCADEPSLHALTRDLAAYYACVRDEAAPPEAAPYPLAHPQKPVTRPQLYQASKRLRLPFERTVRFRGPFDPKHLSLPLPNEVLNQVRQQAIPVEDFLLASWMLLIRRLVDQEDIIVGVGINPKDRNPHCLGPLVKFPPLAAEMGLRQSFADFLKEIGHMRSALHADYPNFSWDKTTTGVGEFLPIAFDTCDRPTLFEADDIRFEIVRRESHVDRFRVKLNCMIQEESPSCTLLYDPRYFSAGEMFRLGGRYQCLLSRIIKAPNSPLGAISLLSDSERRGLLQALNDTARPYPLDRCVHQLFESAVQRNPGRAALRYGHVTLTFAELETRANRMAHVLMDKGAGPETMVVISLPRAPEFVIALLAVLKAGAAFHVLDPQAPTHIQASGFALAYLAVCPRGREPLNLDPARVVHPDHDTIIQAKVTAPKARVFEQNTAMVLASSTTHGPVAVPLSHRSLINYLYWCRELWPETGKTGVFVFASPASTHTLSALFVSLTAGLPVELLHQDATLEDLAGFMRRDHPNGLLKLAPEQLDLLTQLLGPEDLEVGSWTLLLDGEIHPNGAVERFRQNAPHALFVQEYSRDEAGFGNCAFRIRPNDKPRTGIPIGRPTPNNRVYLLNDQLDPAPVDVPGSIYLDGVGLSRGYLNQPALTAQFFVPNPFSDEPGARLFKTDDLACFQPNGLLRFIGRTDRRAVIDGYRVRMAEIEDIIRGQPHVKDVAVGRNKDLDSLGGLVAWVEPEPQMDLLRLRATLQHELPHYTLPIDLILVDDLSMRPDGGAAYLLSRETAQKSWLGPRTPVEYWLAMLWKEILGIPWAGSSTHFFESGGDSILVSRLIAGIRRLFQVDLPVQVIFDAPTIASLAHQINHHRKMGGDGCITHIPAVPRERGLPLSFPQAMLCTLAGGEFRDVTGNQPALLRMDGPLDIHTLERAVHNLLERHEATRTTFFNTGGQPIQVIGFSDSWKLDYLDYTHLEPRDQTREIGWLTTMEPVRIFDLEKDLLFRMTVVKQAENKFLLIMTTHQMICDEGSLEILIRDLAAIYSALVEGNPYPLQPLPLQYGDFAVWQRRRLSGKLFRDQLNWWHRHLLGVPALRLAPEGLKGTPRGATYRFSLPAFWPEMLRGLNGRYSVTSFMTLLTAFKLLIHHQTGAADFCVGSPVSLRNRDELASAVGNFSNMLAIRTEFKGDPTFLQHLNLVKAEVLGAWSHRDLPVSYLNRRLGFHTSRPPLFRILCEVNTPAASPPAFHGLEVKRMPIEVWSGAFDLKLTLSLDRNQLRAAFSYNILVFQQSVMARWAAQLELILTMVFQNPETPLSQIRDALTQQEKASQNPDPQ